MGEENWKTRPTLISYWPGNASYCLFVDENNTNNLREIRQYLRRGLPVPADRKYFTVTGCAMRIDTYRVFRNNILGLKNEFWLNGEYYRVDKNELFPVVFHSYDIRNHRAPFSSEDIDRQRFLKSLTSLIDSTPFVMFSSTIDKEAHCRQYFHPIDPYDLNMVFVIERYAAYLLAKERAYGAIMLESRGKEEDRRLLRRLVTLLEEGSDFVSKDKFKWITGIYFNPKILTDPRNQVACAGLELADLCSYPIHKFSRNGVKDEAFLIIERKFHGYPSYYGKGYKTFPA